MQIEIKHTGTADQFIVTAFGDGAPYYEVASLLTQQLLRGAFENTLAYRVMEKGGRSGFYELADELTTEFETINVGREWAGEFYGEVTAFVKRKGEN